MINRLPFIDYMRIHRPLMVVSAGLMLLSLVLLFTRGIPLGLDFSGGVLMELRFDSSPDIELVRTLLSDIGIRGAVVQFFGADTDLVIRFAQISDAVAVQDASNNLAAQALTAIEQQYPTVEQMRLEFVGAQIGAELVEQGGIGVLVALVAMLVYVAFRFQFKFAIGAVAALFHDVLIVLLVFSIFGLDFDLTVLAAVMTVVGYSINDSLVISDHVREQVVNLQKRDIRIAINTALNEVMGRTINTSLTTLLVSLTLLFFGGPSVYAFSLALSIGVVVGTYSSIYILCAILIQLKLTRTDLVVLERDEQGKTVV